MGFMDEYYKALEDNNQKSSASGSGGSGNSGSSGFMDEFNKAVGNVSVPKNTNVFNKNSFRVIEAPLSERIASRMTVGKKKKKKEEEEKRSWFDKGLFDDGYDFGDISRTILGTTTDVLENVGSGIIGMGEKAVDAIAYIAPFAENAQFYQNGGGYNPELQKQHEQVVEQSKKDLGKFIAKDLYDEEKVARAIISDPARMIGVDSESHSVFGEKSDALIQSGGQLLATAGLAAAGMPWWLTTGVTSFGSEAENAMNQGATYEQAGASAAISAGAEILSEKLSGGISFGGKTLDDALTKQLARGISNKLGRTAAKLGLDMAGEGAEEVFSQVASNLGSSLYKEEDITELLFNEEAMDGYLESFIGGAALGGVSNAYNVVKSNSKGVDYTSGLTQNEQKVVDKLYKDEIASREKEGKVTQKEKSKIYDSILEDMEKGYISIDTIEEVLGGESYSAYKNTVDSEDAILKEYDELGQKTNATLKDQARYSELTQQVKDIHGNSQRNALRAKLNEEVMGLVKGDRLAESYNERVRTGQKYEADVTKYDAKQQAVVQKAIDSGILNNSNRTHEFVDFVSKISADTGVLFDFSNTAKIREAGFAVEGQTVDGFITKDGITVNIDSPKSRQFVVGHEITHALEGTELYDALRKSVFDYAKMKNQYGVRMESIQKRYKEGTDFEAELTADLVGEYIFSDTDFINNLSTQNRNVFQKVYDEIKYLCKVATAGSKEARELEKVKRAFEKAYREGGKTQGGMKYSLTSEAKSNPNVSEVDSYSDYGAGKSVFRNGWLNSNPKMLEAIVKNRKQTETKEFESWFGNSKATNKSAEPLLVYHGTKSRFTEFNSDGKPIWFSPNVMYSRGGSTQTNTGDKVLPSGKVFGGANERVIPAYIKAENPADFGNTSLLFEDVVTDISQNLGIDEAALRNVWEQTGRNAELYKTIHSAEMVELLKQHGYDSITAIEDGSPTWAVFESNQAKSAVANKGSFNISDPDIRYSLSDSDGKQLTKEQQDYFKDSKMRDENGNLKVMYHGSRDAGFHVFDGDFSDDGMSFFFVDRNTVAASYSGTTETYAPRVWKGAEDANNFLKEIGFYGGYYGYEVVENNGKYSLITGGEEIATSDNPADLYEEFCDYEGVGYGDANYKAYLNLKNPLEVDAEGRDWDNVSSEFWPELYEQWKTTFTQEEKYFLADLAREDFGTFRNEIELSVKDAGKPTADKYTKALNSAYWKNSDMSSLFRMAADNFSDEVLRAEAVKQMTTRDFAQKAKAEGYDGVIFKNIVDVGAYGGDYNPATVAIAFDSNQIKSVANANPTADPDIRYSLSDSNGRELSEEQSEYFKDSKVRDKNGSLQVMYHGSPESFTVFDKKKAKSSGLYGKGFYFTNSDSHAKQYGNTYEVYLNITNPLQNGTNDITKDQLRNFVEAIAEDEDYGIENYGYEATVDSVTNNVFGKGDFAMLMDINVTCVGNMVEAIELFNKVNGTGYNGIIAPTETVAFYPEQIKEVTNQNPTDNPDIHRSLSKIGEQHTSDSLSALRLAPAPMKTELSDYAVGLIRFATDGNLTWGKVRQIIDRPEYREAFEEVTGITLEGSRSEQKRQVMNATDELFRYKNMVQGIVQNTTPTWTVDSLSSVLPDAPLTVYTDERFQPLLDVMTDGKMTFAGAKTIANSASLRSAFESLYGIKLPGTNTKAVPHIMSLAEDVNSLEDAYKATQMSADTGIDSITDADAPPEVDAPYYGESEAPETARDPFADRDYNSVGNRKVKSYISENPDVMPHFQMAAQAMLGDLQRSTKGERQYNDELYYQSGGEQGFTGTKRQTTDDIAYLLDNHYTYAQIEQGLNAIISGKGDLNSAVVKKLEFALNDRLLNGYTDISGVEIPPDEGYLNYLSQKQTEAGFQNVIDSAPMRTDAEAPLVAKTVEKNATTTDAPVFEEKGGQQTMFKPVEEKKTAGTRKEYHQSIIDNIKSIFKGRGFDFDKVLKNAKNLSTWSTVDNTPQRVMEKALGYKEGGILADITVNKVAQNETEGIKWLNSYVDQLKQISKQYGIKPGSKESAAAQMYAEGFYVNENNEIIRYGDPELIQDFGNADVRRRIKGLARDPRIRKIYDDTLANINASRARNLYPVIPRLDNYFLHFRAMEDTFSTLGLPFNPNDIRAKDLPTDLNGVTADLKPGQPYFASANHRTGKRTSFDLLGGVERYLNSAKNQIYHIDDIQTLRALRNYVAETYGQATGLEDIDSMTDAEAEERIKQVYDSHLSTFAKFLNEEANVLAGKTALIDRGIEGIIGRRGITFLNALNKQVGSNMVGYNVSSSLTNFLPVVQTFAKTNKFDFTKAFTQTVANKLTGGRFDSFADDSPVVIRRKGEDRFAKTFWQKMADPGYALMGMVDDISTEIIARTKYNEFTRKGMDSQKAHFETDKWVSRLMGDRSLGQQPQLYNSKMLGLVTKFQLEVRNQLDAQFYDTIQETKVSNEHIKNGLARNAKTAAKVASVFTQLAVAQHLYGMAFESMAGYNPAFDIIEVLMTAFGFDDEEDSEDTLKDNLGQGFEALMEDLPYASIVTGGGRIPISSALPIKEFFKGEDQYGNEKNRWETLGEVAPYYLMPGGYGQLKKTTQGLKMFSDDHPIAGSYTDAGNLRYDVEDTVGSRIKAGIFGQYASENAQKYFDQEQRTLNPEQTEIFAGLDIPIEEYWEYRDNLYAFYDVRDALKDAAYADGATDEDVLRYTYINNVYGDIYDLYDKQKELASGKNKTELRKLQKQMEQMLSESKYGVDSMKLSGAYAEVGGVRYNKDADSGRWYEIKPKNADGSDNWYYQKEQEVTKGLGISYEAYWNNREEYNYAYDKPGRYAIAQAVGGYDSYREYYDALENWQSDNYIAADKDDKGNSISGSRKKKVLDYINGLDLDYGERIILYRTVYSSKSDARTYNQQIIDYLNERDDISYQEMKTILEELDMEVDSKGYITW